MNDMFLLYLLTRLDSINLVCGIALGGFCASMLFVVNVTSYGNEIETLKKFTSKYFYIPIIATLFLVFVPTKQDALFIIAGSNIMEIAKSDDTKRIAGKSVQLFESYLNELMKEKGNDTHAK